MGVIRGAERSRQAAYLTLTLPQEARRGLPSSSDIPSAKESEDTDHLICRAEAAPVGGTLLERSKKSGSVAAP